MKNKIQIVASFVVMLVLGFTGMAFAAAAVAPEDSSLLDLARPVYDQITAGNYLAAAALAVVLVVALVRRYTSPDGKVGRVVHSDLGGVATTFAIAFSGAIATAAIAGTSWSLDMVKAAGAVGAIAIGGYTVIKKLIAWFTSTSWYKTKAPTWLKVAMGAVTWIVDKKSPAIADAEKAGDAAVAAKPAGGADSIVGKPEEF